MTEVFITKTIILRAPPKRVWEYLTEPHLLARWFHESQQPLTEGKPYALIRENPETDDPRTVWGDVLVSDPPNRLVYTFDHHGQDEAISATVEWTLTPVAQGTHLTMKHTYNGPSEDALWSDLRGVDSGWDEHLFRLRSALF